MHEPIESQTMTLRPVLYDTNLSSRLSDLKQECLIINNEWQFDITDPETGIHYYALGNGIGIADWRTLWTKSGWIETNGIYPLCLSKNKIDLKTKDYIAKTIHYLGTRELAMFETAKAIAKLTHCKEDYQKNLLEESRKRRAEVKQQTKEQEFLPVPEPILAHLKNHLKQNFLAYDSKILKDTVRRCGGKFIRPSIILPHISGHRIFAFLRDITPEEKSLLEKWAAKTTRNHYLIIPIKSWHPHDLIETTKTLIQELNTILQAPKVS